MLDVCVEYAERCCCFPAETTSSSLPSHTLSKVVQACKGELMLKSPLLHEPMHHEREVPNLHVKHSIVRV